MTFQQKNETSKTCPLCNFQFKESENIKCNTCPLGINNCNMDCCPNCGYQWTDESILINKFKKWFTKQEEKIEKNS